MRRLPTSHPLRCFFLLSERKYSVNEMSIYGGIPEYGIEVIKNVAKCSSVVVANMFDKRHSDVIRAIETVIETGSGDNFSQRNFASVKYVDKKGEKRKAYLMTRAGFSMVVMGFTGKRAYQFKVDYIERFEVMEELIRSRGISKDGYKVMTDAIKECIGNDWKECACEANMINKIVLGMTSKQFKQLNNIEDGIPVRDNIASEKLENLDKAQRLNANLIYAALDHNERARIISANFLDCPF